MKIYSLRRSKKVLLGVYHLLRRKKKKLLPAQINEIQNDLKTLQEEILKKNRENANYLAHKCQDYGSGILKKSRWEQIRDFVFAFAFALVVAFIIRQMWFELYEIPSGSMRPTFKEKDHLIVSKTDFGINVPFTTDHFYFDPNLVKRSGIIIFTVENMDVSDPNTMYFYIFPGKKQFVKRMMGKSGDTVYFYGGQMYGIDKEGNDISHELQPQRQKKIHHVPFIRFSGMATLSEPFQSSMGNAYRMAILHQMNEPVARLTFLGNQRLEGEMLYTQRIHDTNAPLPENYYQLWGMENYAIARIVGKEELKTYAEKNDLVLGEENLYLEMKHHPNLHHLELGKDLYGRIHPQFILSTSVIPLGEIHLKRLFNNLSTERFVVKSGYAKRYSAIKAALPTHLLLRLEDVPDGIYEFDRGQAYQVKWGGILKKLPEDHPLQKYSPDRMRKLFNFGITFDRRFVQGSQFETDRFAYFREGDLCLLEAPIFKKGESELESFIEKEQERSENSNGRSPYIPFLDNGPPLTEGGKIDVQKIKQYGLKIPENMYLALGDNFANSGDSREFGFVPQVNLRGGPSFIFWPFGKRFGPPNQPPYPWWTLPNGIIWSLALVCLILWYVYHRRHHRLPLDI